MKVLYLIDTLAVGGSEQSLLHILQRFKEISPIVCHVYSGDTLKPAFEAQGIPVISLNIPGPYSFQKAIAATVQVLKTYQPTLIHTTLFRADMVGRLAGWLAHTPVISSFVNEPYHLTRKQAISLSGKVRLAAVQGLDYATARLAYHFVAVSQATKHANCEALGIAQQKVSVIYRGRDATPFLSVTQAQIDQLRTTLGLPKNGLVLLNVARLIERKGHDELIEAMPLVLQQFPAAKLFIAGDGYHRSHLEGLITKLGLNERVQLLGLRQDIPVLLQLADLFVFPSHYEGHPGSLIEAMLAARPIVASDIPVHRETIIDYKTGRLAPVKNVEALAWTITQSLQVQEEVHEMGREARKAALQLFDIDQVAHTHERLYRSLAEELKIPV